MNPPNTNITIIYQAHTIHPGCANLVGEHAEAQNRGRDILSYIYLKGEESGESQLAKRSQALGLEGCLLHG